LVKFYREYKYEAHNLVSHLELTALKEEDQQTKPIETAAWEAASRAVLEATFVGTVTLKWMIYLRP